MFSKREALKKDFFMHCSISQFVTKVSFSLLSSGSVFESMDSARLGLSVKLMQVYY
jgi:hypothetical protein